MSDGGWNVTHLDCCKNKEVEAGVRIENKLEYDQEYNWLRETQREKDEPCEENMTNECMSGMRLIDLSLLNKFLDKKACCRICSQRIDVQTGFDFAAFLDNTTDSEKHVSGTSFTKRSICFCVRGRRGGVPMICMSLLLC